MATKSKKFSHSIFIKTMVFLLMIACVAGAIHKTFNIMKKTDGNIEIIFEKSYIESTSFKMENDYTINRLADLIDMYGSKERILAGHTIDKDELANRSESMNEEWEDVSHSQLENTDQLREQMIADDLENYEIILNELQRKDGLVYHVTDGEHTFTNTKQTKKEQFKQYPVYYISDGYDWEIYPDTLARNNFFYGGSQVYRASNPENTQIFVGYTENYIDKLSSEWNEKNTVVMNDFYYLLAYVALFFVSLLYLFAATGRKSFKDKTVYMSSIDKLYVDLNLVLLLVLTGIWYAVVNEFILYRMVIDGLVYVVTLPFVALFIILLLSLARHMKNKTILKHALLYMIWRWLYKLVNDTYNSGTTGMKIVVVVILYPLVTAATLVFFPITIGVAVWLTLKKVKDFQKIQDGAQLMCEGNLQHHIHVDGKGEFATLASNINGINEGFKQAVYNELKNERMKTELITNVSHDIRTPLTSLITYTDLLKTEKSPEKIQEYIEILDQKSKRLKILTDDLFAAAKASSGDIPVDLKKIDIVALVNQGIGEVSEQITAKNLTIKCSFSDEKMYVIADGKLLWRAIENILSNIFNYALEGSRVYIDITADNHDGTLISFKNISKYELNITEEELMERFKRGDESRTGQGSGLGLSITKSLIENQNGKFHIQIDGDLFKSMIYLPTTEKDPR